MKEEHEKKLKAAIGETAGRIMKLQEACATHKARNGVLKAEKTALEDKIKKIASLSNSIVKMAAPSPPAPAAATGGFRFPPKKQAASLDLTKTLEIKKMSLTDLEIITLNSIFHYYLYYD
eukprot:SAG22_NODE_8526_length_648_cov_1.043716_1_plen_120_part_00